MHRLAVFLLLSFCAGASADVTEQDFLTNAATFLKSSPKGSLELEKADIWVFIHLMPKELSAAGCKSAITLIDSAIAQKNARGYFARVIVSERCAGISSTRASDISDAAKISPIYSEVVKGISQAAEDGKQKGTMADMRSFAMAVEGYAVDENAYPEETTGGTAALVTKLQPTYIKQLPLKDAWGNPFRYYCPNPQGDYWIISFGRDGIAESGIYNANGIPNNAATGTIQNLDGDLIFSGGMFIRSPYPVKKYETTKPAAPAPQAELSTTAKADQHFRYSEFASAAQLYKQALKENPKQSSKLTEQIVKCYYNLGVISLRDKNCKLATDYFRQNLFLKESDQPSKEALEISRKCEDQGFDSISMSVVFLEFRK